MRALAATLLLAAGAASAALESPAADPVQLVLQRRSEGLFLSARLPLELSPAVEEVLRKGVPLHFLWKADLIQSRWYWLDKTVASVARTVRAGLSAADQALAPELRQRHPRRQRTAVRPAPELR